MPISISKTDIEDKQNALTLEGMLRSQNPMCSINGDDRIRYE